MESRRKFSGLAEDARRAAMRVPAVSEAVVRLGLRATSRTPGPGAGEQVSPRRSPDSVARLLGQPAVLHGPPLVVPADAPATLTDALARAAEGGRGTTYLLGDGREQRQTYQSLLEDAARVAAGLKAQGLRPADSVLLHCDDSRAFVTGFWGCVLGGFVPTPIGMAPSYRVENAVTRRIQDAWELLDQPFLLTDRLSLPRVSGLSALWGSGRLEMLAVEDLLTYEPASQSYPAGPEHPVVHLLTSGSTGAPKCVRHCHRTVITRAYANVAANGFGSDEVTLNFMPLDHVAGMIMHNVRDVVLGYDHVNARTDTFLADPLLWFTWIERYGVTNTSAPNFVITLVTQHAEDIAQRRWDLSTLRDITNGGEAIVSSTTHRFLRLLGPHGLRPDVMRPAWGMSELCGGVVHSTLRGDDESAGVATVDQWATDGSLTFLPSPAPGHATFVEVGVPAPGASLRIVDSSDCLRSEDHVGRLQVRGPTLMPGYHRNSEATDAATTADGWFDTGDLGFVHGGRLTMTGREKDVIVIRSANYPCHEIESVVGDIGGVVPTLVAACGDRNPRTGADELVLFCAFVSEDPEARRGVVSKIRQRVATEIGIAPSRIVPVRRESFPRTSAGKIERHRLLADLHAGVLHDAVGPEPDAGATWLFSVGWTPAASVSGPLPAGPWLVFDAHGLAADLAPHAPGPVVAVHQGLVWSRTSSVSYSIDLADQRHYDRLLAAVLADHGTVGAVVHAWATDLVGEPSADLDRSALSVHRVLKASGGTWPRMLVVTSGACPVDRYDPVTPLNATVLGLVRTANAERGTKAIRLLDLRPNEAESASRVLSELADEGDDDVVVRSRDRRLVPRLRPCSQPAEQPAHRIRQGGLYLITGGLGRLGQHIGHTLLTEYGATLIVNGRSPSTGERADRLASLAAFGDVTYLRGDVADLAALRAGVEGVERRCGRTLDGAVHLAGEDIDSTWNDVDAHLVHREASAQFHRMYHAKVRGALALAELLDDRPDALLVVASSANGYFGGAAFGAYSSASSFLPALVDQRRRRGYAAQCQSWSLWADGSTSARRAAVERHGFRSISADRGVRLFEAALAEPDSQVLIGLDESKTAVAEEVDPDAVLECGLVVTYHGSPAVDPAAVRDAVATSLGLATSLVRVEASDSAAWADRAATISDKALDHPDAELTTAITSLWRSTLDRPTIGLDESFFDLGGDSLMAMRLVSRISAQLGVDITVEDIYEHPTVRELSRRLALRSRSSK